MFEPLLLHGCVLGEGATTGSLQYPKPLIGYIGGTFWPVSTVSSDSVRENRGEHHFNPLALVQPNRWINGCYLSGEEVAILASSSPGKLSQKMA